MPDVLVGQGIWCALVMFSAVLVVLPWHAFLHNGSMSAAVAFVSTWQQHWFGIDPFQHAGIDVALVRVSA